MYGTPEKYKTPFKWDDDFFTFCLPPSTICLNVSRPQPAFTTHLHSTVAKMFAKSLALFALAASVAAQSANSTATSAAANPSASAILGGLSPCIIQCVSGAATLNKCSFTDVSCVCSSAQFQVDAAACLTAHCTPADLTAALNLQSTQCTAAGITPTGSAGAPQSVPFTLASSAAGTATGAPAGTATGAPASGTATTPAATPTAPATGAGTSAPAPSKTGSAAESLTVGVAGLLAAVAAVLAL
ncbi:hypothetical protein D9619_002260 [Psilocybe cf. subviscida]|uniref:CFEM domain-containing protein n=1 Tax=Psilocybe cf. subviscida TaxID=2480587 RepID=A0A8H5BIT8_9AGAR|nr:hypothetical protein D9619_002260 [Psilocybe cf. subviscida]